MALAQYTYDNIIKPVEYRYYVRVLCRRHEIIDRTQDSRICYADSSEYAEEICYAMNEQNNKNKET